MHFRICNMIPRRRGGEARLLQARRLREDRIFRQQAQEESCRQEEAARGSYNGPGLENTQTGLGVCVYYVLYVLLIIICIMYCVL